MYRIRYKTTGDFHTGGNYMRSSRNGVVYFSYNACRRVINALIKHHPYFTDNFEIVAYRIEELTVL